MKRVITTPMAQYIYDNYMEVTSREIGEHLGIPKGTVESFKKRYGLRVPKQLACAKRRKGMSGKTILTTEEDQFIKDNYLNIPVKRMADIMGRGDSLIQRRVRQLGLVIPPEIIEKRKKESQIKPGTTPANKGKKQVEYMSPEMIERTKATRFKKGQIPKNAIGVKDGDIRPRHDKRTGITYLYIRIRMGKWQELHRYIWEKANGKIPREHCLRFINGDTQDVRLDNLELITQKENRIRNSASVILSDTFVAQTMAWRDPELRKEILKHPELIELKRQSLLLNRAINEQTKH